MMLVSSLCIQGISHLHARVVHQHHLRHVTMHLPLRHICISCHGLTLFIQSHDMQIMSYSHHACLAVWLPWVTTTSQIKHSCVQQLASIRLPLCTKHTMCTCGLMQPLDQYICQHMLQKHLKLQHHCSHAMLLTCFLHVNEKAWIWSSVQTAVSKDRWGNKDAAWVDMASRSSCAKQIHIGSQVVVQQGWWRWNLPLLCRLTLQR